MTKQTRLDAPPADLRALDRGPACTKTFKVEPRVCPTAAQERAALEKKWAAEESQRLAKSAAPASSDDLAKAVKTMADLANIVLKAAERIEKAAPSLAPDLKSALAKIDQALALKKGR